MAKKNNGKKRIYIYKCPIVFICIVSTILFFIQWDRGKFLSHLSNNDENNRSVCVRVFHGF